MLNFPSSIIPKDCLVEKGGDLSLGDIRRYWEKTYLGDNESREKKKKEKTDNFRPSHYSIESQKDRQLHP